MRAKTFHCSRDRTFSHGNASHGGNTSHGRNTGHAEARRLQHTIFAAAVTEFDKRLR